MSTGQAGAGSSARRGARHFEALSNAAWTMAIKTRNWMKRVGLLGRLDGVTAYIGPRLLPPPKVETQVAIRHDIALIVPPRSPSHRNYATGLYEVDVTRIVSSILRPGMAVVDLGANIGYYTLLASRLVGGDGVVHSFEPDPEAFSYLVRNVTLNECLNIVPINKAVGDALGIVSFSRPEPERGYISRDSHGGIVVDQVVLDSYFGELGWPPVNLVKMDIEGSEQRALMGMEQLVRRNPKIQITMELNADAAFRSGTSLSSLVATIERLGLTDCYVIELRRRVPLTDLLLGSRAIHNLLLSWRDV